MWLGFILSLAAIILMFYFSEKDYCVRSAFVPVLP